MPINKMYRVVWIYVCMCFLVDISAMEQVNDLEKRIEVEINKSLQKYKIPAMFVAVADSQRMSIAAQGVCKIGSDQKVGIDNKIHIGSCGKAMTSALLAVLVAEQKLSWDSKMVDVLPGLKNDIHADYHQITLWQLVTHRAAVPASALNWLQHKKLPMMAQRLQIIRDNLCLK